MDLPRLKDLLSDSAAYWLGIMLNKMLGFILFYRDRLLIDGELHNDSISFRADLVWLDYELRPKLWIECDAPGCRKLGRELRVVDGLDRQQQHHHAS